MYFRKLENFLDMKLNNWVRVLDCQLARGMTFASLYQCRRLLAVRRMHETDNARFKMHRPFNLRDHKETDTGNYSDHTRVLLPLRHV